MKLYDTMIARILELERRPDAHFFPYDRTKAWPENEDYECIFTKETGLTLGGGTCTGCNLICAATDPQFFHGDRTVLIGPDLGKMKGNASFVRITLLLTEEILAEGADASDPADIRRAAGLVGNTEAAFRILQQMDFVKYHVFPKGYMVRVSGQSAAEQVRVSKKALSRGISLEQIGNTYLNHYKEDPKVLCAEVIFLTAQDLDYGELKQMASHAEDIRNSLSVIMKGIAADCGSCSIREVCSEIEGLRELHFGKEGAKT